MLRTSSLCVRRNALMLRPSSAAMASSSGEESVSVQSSSSSSESAKTSPCRFCADLAL